MARYLVGYCDALVRLFALIVLSISQRLPLNYNSLRLHYRGSLSIGRITLGLTIPTYIYYK